MLSAAGNDYGKAGKEAQAPTAYESNFSALMSKKKGVRRVKFQDTDDNSVDAEATDYSASDVSIIFPHSTSFGSWDETTMIVAEINAARKSVPKFYETYCTQETVTTLSAILTQIDTAISESDTDSLVSLKTSLEEALKNVAYKSDSKIAQVYVATDKGDGTSYGTDPSTGLKKADGYVSAQMVVVSTDGGIMAEDLSWAGQIKVRGNSTAGYAKRPYNVKFSSKVDLFGFGASKKWTLLADYLDPTLMRNKTALDLSEILGLDSTMAHQHVEVWVDGAYRGMYLLTEKIEADEKSVNINTKNGDFLLETVVAGEEEAGNIYFTAASGQKFRLREPEKEEKIEEVKAKVDDFESTIASGTWDEITEKIDVDSFVSYYILNEFMMAYDTGWPKSVYFHCKDGKYYGGPGWDYDWSSGNHSTNTSAAYILMDNKIYYKYLVKHTEFQLKVSEKLSQISEPLSLLSNSISECAEYYAEAIERNNEVWSVTKTLASWNRTPDSTYAENLTFLTDWLSARYDWMTDYFLNRTFISSDTFPDSTLLEYAKTLDTDSDSFLSSAEKLSVTSIDLSGMNLSSLNLAGLEIFTQLQSLDLTNNPLLTHINIQGFMSLNILHDDTLSLADGVPSFSKHSLVLSGQIGVDFYVTIPEGIDTEGAYTDFTVNGRTGTPAMLSNAVKTESGDYMFTCYINSVQMADTITAAFHYGNDETITNEYSAKDYLDTVLDDSTYPEKLVNLVKAIKDFGHYVQKPLADNNNWTIGTDHQEMDYANDDILSDSEEIKASLSAYEISRDINGTGIESLMFDLELESETTINIYLYPEKDYAGAVNAYLEGSSANMAVKQQDGSYRITISGISAHLLGETQKINVEAEKNFAVEVSALSYAYAVIKSSEDENLKKAAAALYKYYDATVKYRAED